VMEEFAVPLWILQEPPLMALFVTLDPGVDSGIKMKISGSAVATDVMILTLSNVVKRVM